MLSTSLALYLAGMMFQGATAPAAAPIIDNNRTTVWDTSSPAAYSHDYVAITLANGTAKLGAAGTTPDSKGRTIVIEIKDHPRAIANKSGYPNAFPRPGSKKLLENEKVIVWDYTWTQGVATPMHFHDKEVVVTYLKDGSLKSVTPAGESTVNDYTFGTVKFNLANRTHAEMLIKGSQRAIIVEFK
jgi:hypothetical protein